MGILSAFPGKAKPKLQSKTVTPSESKQKITADAKFDGLDMVTVDRIPTSYVKPSATQGSKIWMPGTSDLTIPAGTYLSGDQTIAGEQNLLAENIRAGVSVFGKTGTLKPVGIEQVSTLISNYLYIPVNNPEITRPTVVLYSLEEITTLDSKGETSSFSQCVLAMKFQVGETTYQQTSYYLDSDGEHVVFHGSLSTDPNGATEVIISFTGYSIEITSTNATSVFFGEYVAIVY